MKFLRDLIGFLKNVTQDQRIPKRDKLVLGALIASIISPIDLIPDWIPIIGVLDDLVVMAIVLDYFFEHLDQDVILSHYPWGMRSFVWIRRASRVVSQLAPGFIKSRIWKYKPDIYKD